MENSLQSPPLPRPAHSQGGAKGSASPPSPLRISLSFKNGQLKTLERFYSARTLFATPDAERTQLLKVFQRFDDDGDGKLTVQEITGALEKLGLIIPAADLASFLCGEPVDSMRNDNGCVEDANCRIGNGSERTQTIDDAHEHVGSFQIGYVDFSEFCNLYRSLCQEANDEDVICTPHGNLSDPELRSAFDLFDKNHDNFISVTELQSVLISLGFREANSLEECKSMVASVDSDGDGMVSFNEFKTMMRKIEDDQ